MIFRVCEHYDDNQPVYSYFDRPEECFICYEVKTDSEPCTISLKYQVNYNKPCGCDGWIHKKCLDMWYGNKQKCPICRVTICERKSIICAVINVGPYSNRIYVFLCNSLYRIATIFAYSFLIFSILEFYSNVIITKHKHRNSYQNNIIHNAYSELNSSELIDNFIEN